MNEKKASEQIYVVWKDPNTRKRYAVGELSRNSKYIFQYNLKEADKAIKLGFQPLVAFPDINEIYTHTNLFLTFLCRLPDRRRGDIKIILNRYGMSEFDAFELLARSEGKLPTDTLEFIKPIFLYEENIERYFFIAGTRHYDICNISSCVKNIDLEIGDELILKCESENEFDKYAVIITNRNNDVLGYVPKYYSEPIYKALNKKREIKCVIASINDKENCQECIRVKLSII